MKYVLFLLSLFPLLCFSESKLIGKTYPISEPDPYKQIAERSAAIDFSKKADEIKKKQTFIKKFRTEPLPRTTQALTTLVTPKSTSPTDIYGKDGLLYPKGFEFNPLDYKKMNGRIVIIDQSDIGNINIIKSDTVIINKGDIKQSAMALKQPVYILDHITASTLTHLRTSPTIIQQKGNQLEYTQINLD